MKLSLITFLSIFTTAIYAQNLSVDSKGSSMKFFGTSTLHDWHMWAEQKSGSAVLEKDDKRVKSISSLTFVVEVESLKSGKSAMDKNTYNALNYKQHKEIKYALTKVESINPSKDGKGYIITAVGNLTIAGKTNVEKFKVYSLVQSDGSVKFIGKVEFPMTKYDVDPPTAVMGTIKTGDDLRMEFNVVYR